MKAADTNIFYLPCAYLHRVRLEHEAGRIVSWWFLLVVPTLGYYLQALSAVSPLAIGSYLLLLAAVVPYYELGYMFNDTYTTRRESNPTLRLSADQMDYFYHHVGIVMGIRLVWVLGLLCMYGMLNDWHQTSLITIVAILLLLPLFTLYNHIRGFSTTLVYPVLVSWRYLVFLIPCWGAPSWTWYLILLLLSYPLEISIERFSMPHRRYGWMAKVLPNEASKTRFRAGYYAILVLLLTPFWIKNPLAGAPILTLGIYRWIRLFFAKK